MSIDRILLMKNKAKSSLVERLGHFGDFFGLARKKHQTTTRQLKSVAYKSLVAIALLLGANNLKANDIHVDRSALGSNDGSSWFNACIHLQDALAYAQPGDTIKIAQGKYTPDLGNNNKPHDKEASFSLKNGVAIKGGYAGINNPDPDARHMVLYETILSGDLNNNDVPVDYPFKMLGDPSRADNSIHVVISQGDDPTAVLDGVTITGGESFNAISGGDYDHDSEHGSAIFIRNSSPTIRNCRTERNSGCSAVYIYLSNPQFSNCDFTYNLGLGGAVRNLDSNTYMINCNLLNNHGEYGGAITSIDSSLTMTECNMKHNMADYGGAMYIVTHYLIAENCNVLSNFAPIGGGLYLENNQTQETLNLPRIGDNGDGQGYKVLLVNCAIINNSATSIGGGILNKGTDSIITNSIFYNNGLEQIIDLTDKPNITYSCVQGGYPGEGNISNDPMFKYFGHFDDNGTPGDRSDDIWVDGDYHLLSKGGRFNPETGTWAIDDVTSPCIDAGDPASPIGEEPEPNGRRINIGAYGGTNQASRSP